MTNLNILEQFEYSPDTGSNHFTGKNPDKTFLPNDQEKTMFAHILQQCLEHCPTEHNKWAVFHQNHLHYKLSAMILQKGPTLSKKRQFFRIFGNFSELLENLDISKIILELFSGNSGRNLTLYFGNYVAKPNCKLSCFLIKKRF